MSVIKRIIVIIIVLSLASISCQAPSIDLTDNVGQD